MTLHSILWYKGEGKTLGERFRMIAEYIEACEPNSDEFMRRRQNIKEYLEWLLKDEEVFV